MQIQCKRYTKQTIGVLDVRTLLGVIHDRKVTKGILITTTKFSPESRKFEDNNPSIELIDYSDLIKLLNTYLGTYWTEKLDKIINEQKLKNKNINMRSKKCRNSELFNGYGQHYFCVTSNGQAQSPLLCQAIIGNIINTG